MTDEDDEIMEIVRGLLEKETDPNIPALPEGRPMTRVAVAAQKAYRRKITPKLNRVRKEVNANARVHIE